MPTSIVCVGAVYIDTILSVPRYPSEDEKLRATGHVRRRGGNCANTLEVLQGLIAQSDASQIGTRNKLFLLTVLPSKRSFDVDFIRNSIPDVEIDAGCIFREDYQDAASSYIIQAKEKNSRTIVSHNPLPEMATKEFVESASTIIRVSPAQGCWFHFEGRIPIVTEQSVVWLRENLPQSKISVECEKPDRVYMARVSEYADVVFFSRLWVEAKSYRDPRAFLVDQLPNMKPGAILVCTWGSEGATCVRTPDNENETQWASVIAWKPYTGEMVTDTIGAGDTFIAGFTFATNFHESWTLQRKLQFANEIAGRKVLQDGFRGLAEQMSGFGTDPQRYSEPDNAE